MAAGNKGFDVQCPRFGKVEVRGRVLGTDGHYPRITLRRSPSEGYDHLAAVRFERDFSFWRAIILPAAALGPLYEVNKQKKGSAHISWHTAAESPSTVDISDALRGVLDASDCHSRSSSQ
jgi:hypothetical protein